MTTMLLSKSCCCCECGPKRCSGCGCCSIDEWTVIMDGHPDQMHAANGVHRLRRKGAGACPGSGGGDEQEHTDPHIYHYCHGLMTIELRLTDSGEEGTFPPMGGIRYECGDYTLSVYWEDPPPGSPSPCPQPEPGCYDWFDKGEFASEGDCCIPFTEHEHHWNGETYLIHYQICPSHHHGEKNSAPDEIEVTIDGLTACTGCIDTSCPGITYGFRLKNLSLAGVNGTHTLARVYGGPGGTCYWIATSVGTFSAETYVDDDCVTAYPDGNIYINLDLRVIIFSDIDEGGSLTNQYKEVWLVNEGFGSGTDQIVFHSLQVKGPEESHCSDLTDDGANSRHETIHENSSICCFSLPANDVGDGGTATINWRVNDDTVTPVDP